MLEDIWDTNSYLKSIVSYCQPKILGQLQKLQCTPSPRKRGIHLRGFWPIHAQVGEFCVSWIISALPLNTIFTLRVFFQNAMCGIESFLTFQIDFSISLL